MAPFARTLELDVPASRYTKIMTQNGASRAVDGRILFLGRGSGCNGVPCHDPDSREGAPFMLYVIGPALSARGL